MLPTLLSILVKISRPRRAHLNSGSKFSSGFTLALLIATSGFAQPPSTQPGAGASQNSDLGKLFRSRLDGIQLNPPAGGALIRELNSGEIVRFVYAEKSWDVRVKPIELHVPMQLSAPPDSGLLELTVMHLTDTNPTTKILRNDVTSFHGKDVAEIEATYKAGTDQMFSQQALFKDTNQHYLSVEMTNKESAQEDDVARNVFKRMVDSVRLLDRVEVGKEQVNRILNTRGLWVLMDRKTITAALQPLHFMRIVRDGRDVGFVQVNEREAKHNGNDGIEIVTRSRVQLDQTSDASAGTAVMGPPAPAQSTGTIITQQIGQAAAVATRPVGPQNVYSQSTCFVTFDRDHEDWTSISQTDNLIANQLTESAYSDKTMRRRFDPTRARGFSNGTPRSATSPSSPANRNALHDDVKQPPIVEEPKYILNVAYSHGHRLDPPTPDINLPPFYLPQALGQLLPRLLPTDTGQYAFAFYVSNQRNVMLRYVDVESPRMVDIDGQQVQAIPITDRIGIDGIPTTHFVTRTGEWLGTISEDSKLQVYPTDEHTLKGLWPDFAVSPEPGATPDGSAVQP